MEKYINYTADISNGIVWHHIQFSYAIPNMLAAVYHPSEAVQKARLQTSKHIWEAIKAAEKETFDGWSKREKDALAQMLLLVAWNRTQIAREAIGVCEKAGWDPENSELRELVLCLYGRPATTIFHLENIFNHLSTIIKRLRKNSKMNRWFTSHCVPHE